MVLLTGLVILGCLLIFKSRGPGGCLETVPLGMTWQLEFPCSCTADGQAGLFCWGPLMLVF